MDPKLLQARSEIEAILTRHDIAAHVVLHNAPGNAEVFMRLMPSYSRLKQTGTELDGVCYRLQSKLADYQGDQAAQQRDLAATANMLHAIAMAVAQDAIPLLQLAAQVNKATGATHGKAERPKGTMQ